MFGALHRPTSVLWDGSTVVIDALLRCRDANISVVPVTGRGRVQVRELCRRVPCFALAMGPGAYEPPSSDRLRSLIGL